MFQLLTFILESANSFIPQRKWNSPECKCRKRKEGRKLENRTFPTGMTPGGYGSGSRSLQVGPFVTEMTANGYTRYVWQLRLIISAISVMAIQSVVRGAKSRSFTLKNIMPSPPALRPPLLLLPLPSAPLCLAKKSGKTFYLTKDSICYLTSMTDNVQPLLFKNW